MPDYQSTLTVHAPAQVVFEFVSDVQNMPKYLPTTHEAHAPSPGKVQLRGEVHGEAYEGTGWIRSEDVKDRMEWGGDGKRDYHGWMDIQDQGDHCQVTVNITLNPTEEFRQQFEARSGNMDAQMQDSVERALQSIKNFCEGTGGKVESPVSHAS